MSDDQELIPIDRQAENGEQLTQSGLEEAEATSERALIALPVSRVDFYGDGLICSDLLAAGSPAWLAVQHQSEPRQASVSRASPALSWFVLSGAVASFSARGIVPGGGADQYGGVSFHHHRVS